MTISLQDSTLINTSKIILLKFDQIIEWDTFIDQTDNWLSTLPDITKLERVYGMDRHELRLSFEHVYFNLNFEHYSDSCWIEPAEPNAAGMLQDLNQYLQLSML